MVFQSQRETATEIPLNLTTGLMLVTVALTEEAETPLGHAGVFDSPGGNAEGTDDVSMGRNRRREGMVNTIGDAVKLLEYSERYAQGPPREEIYSSLRNLAEEEQERANG